MALPGFQERALPNLDNNIKCGNSLIGSDYFTGQLLRDTDELRRVNPFNWEHEFPEVMKAGGFDCVVGNPPWGAEFTETELAYHRRENHEIIVRMIDSFMYFVYQGCKKLNDKGCLGMILPDVVLYQQDNMKLREFILRNFKINFLLNVGDVFEKVTRPAAIVILEQGKPHQHSIWIADLSGVSKAAKPAAIVDSSRYNDLLQDSILRIPGALFVTSDPTRYAIWEKVKSFSAHATPRTG